MLKRHLMPQNDPDRRAGQACFSDQATLQLVDNKRHFRFKNPEMKKAVLAQPLFLSALGGWLPNIHLRFQLFAGCLMTYCANRQLV
jgi:hypothetical protein